MNKGFQYGRFFPGFPDESTVDHAVKTLMSPQQLLLVKALTKDADLDPESTIIGAWIFPVYELIDDKGDQI